MRARLHLSYMGGPVVLSATVVEYLRAAGAVYSWAGPLREFDRQPGLLMLDDGRRVDVVVDGPFLRGIE
jgi:hypothetical protein